ncbi:hypothetical protein BUB20358_06579 [Burkholderia ubonensis]|nr:hypothetical protein BUB20358_06579 [Burkholderia ubonensis]
MIRRDFPVEPRQRRAVRIEQPSLDEHLRVGQRAVAEPRESVAPAQAQLVIDQAGALAIETVDQIRADEVGERSRVAVAQGRAQVALHGQFPMQAPTVRRIDEEVHLAERPAVDAQREVGRDEPQRRPVREEEFEQALGIAPEAHRPQPFERAVQRLGRGVERDQPRLRGRPLGGIGPRLRQRRAGRRCEQARARQQPRQIAYRGVAQRFDERRRRAGCHCADRSPAPGMAAPRMSVPRNVSRARHRSAQAFDLSCRLRSR